MTINKVWAKRLIILWGILIILFFVEVIAFKFFLPRKALTVNAHKGMRSAFQVVLNKTELGKNYKIKISSSETADIIVECDKKDDESYSKIAYSPFVVAFCKDDDLYSSLKKSKLLRTSKYEDDYCDFNLEKLINGVLDNKKMKELGFLSEATICVPSEKSKYWSDFYNLMLITVNKGVYPKDENQIQELKQKIDSFLNSKKVSKFNDLNEQLIRTNYFSKGAVYIIPEQEARYYNSDQSKYCKFCYPLYTVNVNYYVKGITKNGKKVISKISANKFFQELKDNYFRNDEYPQAIIGWTEEDARDSYNVINPYDD